MAETATLTLSEFLLARIAEDEAEQEPGYESVAWHRADCERFTYDAGPCDCGLPARVLAECAAKRAIVEEYAEVADNDDPDETYEYAHGWVHGLGFAIRQLATVHADHPDYREEWRV